MPMQTIFIISLLIIKFANQLPGREMVEYDVNPDWHFLASGSNYY